MTDWAVIGIIATIITVGIALAGIHVAISIYMLRRMDAVSERMDDMQKEVSEVKERMARLEGILIGRLEVSNGAFTQTGTGDA